MTQLLHPAAGDRSGPPSGPIDLGGLVQSLFLLGWREIHLEPRAGGLLVRVRGPEGLSELRMLPAGDADELWRQLRERTGLRGRDSEPAPPVNGKFALLDDGPALQVDAALVSTVRGWAATLSLSPAARYPLPLRSYGIDPERAGQLEDLLRGPAGLVALCARDTSHALGPAYSLITAGGWDGAKVVAVEREPFHEAQTLVQIAHRGDAAALAELLPAALALKPDLLLVDGIAALDEQTASRLLRDAGTACLTAAVLPVGGVLSGLSYLLQLPRGRFLAESVLRGVAGTRIFPRLCPSCREPIYLEGPPPEGGPETADAPQGYRPAGCDACRHTGYAGWKTVLEVLPLGDFVLNAVRRGEPVDKLAALIDGSGALDGAAQCLEAIRNGDISIGTAAGADGRFGL